MNKIYWVGLKSDRFNFHSETFQTYGEAKRRLNAYAEPDRAVLRIYSLDRAFKPDEIDQIQVSYPLR